MQFRPTAPRSSRSTPRCEDSPSRGWRRWGTELNVTRTLAVIREFQAAHPEAPRLGIGDLSRPRGGPFGREFGGLGHAAPERAGRRRLLPAPRPPRAAAAQAEPGRPPLSQDLVNRFVAAGAQMVFVGPRVGLHGPRGVVQRLVHHDHVHVRWPKPLTPRYANGRPGQQIGADQVARPSSGSSTASWFAPPSRDGEGRPASPPTWPVQGADTIVFASLPAGHEQLRLGPQRRDLQPVLLCAHREDERGGGEPAAPPDTPVCGLQSGTSSARSPPPARELKPHRVRRRLVLARIASGVLRIGVAGGDDHGRRRRRRWGEPARGRCPAGAAAGRLGLLLAPRPAADHEDRRDRQHDPEQGPVRRACAGTSSCGSSATDYQPPLELLLLLDDAETSQGGSVTAFCLPDEGRASELVAVPRHPTTRRTTTTTR